MKSYMEAATEVFVYLFLAIIMVAILAAMVGGLIWLVEAVF